MNTLYAIRGGRPEDANSLLDIDIKCFEDAWTAEHWSKIGHDQDYAMSVATYFGTPIGFGVFTEREGGVEIVKLAVKSGHRRQGVSRGLLDSGVSFARRQTNARAIFIVLPESMVYDADRGATQWLAKLGFKATKPILKKHFTVYGEPEDGVKFTAPVWNNQ